MKLSLIEVNQRIKALYGGQFELVTYSDTQSPVTIRCSEHGLVTMRAANFLAGRGCPKCGASRRRKGKNHPSKGGVAEFIRLAREVHGDRFTYCEADFINKSLPVRINCPEHGEFRTTPKKHINGRAGGCPDCNSRQPLTSASFIEQARVKHGDKFDYSRVNYKTAKIKVEIVCPYHGAFQQRPWAHLKGDGCPSCHGRTVVQMDAAVEKKKRKPEKVKAERPRRIYLPRWARPEKA